MAITRNIPFTKTESLLAEICEQSFFRAWSYPSLYTNEGITKNKEGKELCDNTVVFRDTIILFSDKEIKFNTEKAKDVAWDRFRRKAIEDSFSQLKGAEKHLLDGGRIFHDKHCKEEFLIDKPLNPKIYKICVTSAYTDEKTGMEHSYGSSPFEDKTPFKINYNKEKVLVFSLQDLKKILEITDNFRDFMSYLDFRTECVFERESIFDTEMDLFGLFLSEGNIFQHTNFHESSIRDASLIVLDGDCSVKDNSPLLKKINYIQEESRLWDSMIAYTAKNLENEILEANYSTSREQEILNHSRTLSCLADESRAGRWQLTKAIWSKLEENLLYPKNNIRHVRSPSNPRRHYSFCFYHTNENDRSRVHQLMETILLKTNLRNQISILDEIIVIGFEYNGMCIINFHFGFLKGFKIEKDVMPSAQEIKELNRGLTTNLMRADAERLLIEKQNKKVGRNEQCPCGSKIKYKKCCGRYSS